MCASKWINWDDWPLAHNWLRCCIPPMGYAGVFGGTSSSGDYLPFLLLDSEHLPVEHLIYLIVILFFLSKSVSVDLSLVLKFYSNGWWWMPSSLALPFANHVTLGKLLYFSEHELSQLQKQVFTPLIGLLCGYITHLKHLGMCLVDFINSV